MTNIIYTKYGFNIYRADAEFIIHRIGAEFKDAHTHVNSFKNAKYLIYLCHNKKMPHNLSRRNLTSLVRMTDDGDYKDKLQELINTKESKSDIKYYNVNKGKKNKDSHYNKYERRA